MDSAKLGTSSNKKKADIALDIGVSNANMETVDAWSCLNA